MYKCDVSIKTGNVLFQNFPELLRAPQAEPLGSEGYLAGLSLSVVRNPVRFDPGKQQRRRDS